MQVANDKAALILVENARGAMGQLLQMVSKAMHPPKKGIEQPSFISEGVEVPEDAYIGAFVYIGRNVRLGKGVQIYPQVYIGDNVIIGDNAILYAGVRVYAHCKVGADCILHSGVVIGADGFGFEPDAQGVNQKIPQIGNVIIEDDGWTARTADRKPAAHYELSVCVRDGKADILSTFDYIKEVLGDRFI